MKQKNPRALAVQLEAARLRKQAAEPRSKAWYEADSDIERITKELYAGRSVDINLDEEVES